MRRVITAPGYDRTDRTRSLWVAIWWIETFVRHGPGDVQGEPVVLPDEFTEFILDAYALDENGRRLHDSAFFSRPKGCNKSGLASYIALFEAFGPARFADWAEGGETYEYLGRTYTYRAGEPMGRQVKVPVVRIMATEEGQTGHVYDTITHNLTDDGCPLHQLVGYGMVAGVTKIAIPGGGEIIPSTAGAASKDGGKETFVVFDESHLYNNNTLRTMYSTVTRNLVKRRKNAETWYLETTTMYAPGEESIAEQTYNYADLVEEGRAKRAKLLFDHRWSDLEHLEDLDALALAVEEAYGDALAWNSLEAVIDDILDPRRSPADSRRYFLNAVTNREDAWVTPAQVGACAKLAQNTPKPKPREEITLGFDGSVSDDATVLMGCRVSDGFLWQIYAEEKPDGPESKDWQVNPANFDAAVAWAFRTFRVVGFYADPPYFQDYLTKWVAEYGDRLVAKASGRDPIAFWTLSPNRMAPTLERLHTAIAACAVPISATPGSSLRRHLVNTRKRVDRTGKVLIGKETPKSPHKIDSTPAGALAYEARADYIGATNKGKRADFAPRRIRRR